MGRDCESVGAGAHTIEGCAWFGAHLPWFCCSCRSRRICVVKRRLQALRRTSIPMRMGWTMRWSSSYWSSLRRGSWWGGAIAPACRRSLSLTSAFQLWRRRTERSTVRCFLRSGWRLRRRQDLRWSCTITTFGDRTAGRTLIRWIRSTLRCYVACALLVCRSARADGVRCEPDCAGFHAAGGRSGRAGVDFTR